MALITLLTCYNVYLGNAEVLDILDSGEKGVKVCCVQMGWSVLFSNYRWGVCILVVAGG
jgi:hypothetical protein